MDEERIGAEELAVLREVVRLVDEARQRYDKHPRGAGGQRMPDEIDGLLCRLYEMGAHPADTRQKPPASRVLGDVEAWRRFAERCVERDHQPDEHIGDAKCIACEAEDAIRAAKGGAT
jgi:hypothetical protein